MEKFPSRAFNCLCALSMAALATVSMTAGAQEPVFPVAPEETITLADGRTVEVYKATVQHVSGNRLTVSFPDGERHTYTVPAERRFSIDGREVRARDLRRGDELTAYVTKTATADHELVVIEEVEESGGYEIVQAVAPEPVTDTLPATASVMPLIGLLGALSAGLGALGYALRRNLAA